MTNEVTGTPPRRRLEDSFVNLPSNNTEVRVNEIVSTFNAPQSPQKDKVLRKIAHAIVENSDNLNDCESVRQNLFEQKSLNTQLSRELEAEKAKNTQKQKENEGITLLYNGARERACRFDELQIEFNEFKAGEQDRVKDLIKQTLEVQRKQNAKESSSFNFSDLLLYGGFALTTTVGAGTLGFAYKAGNIAVSVLGGLTTLIGAQAAAIKAIEDSETVN